MAHLGKNCRQFSWVFPHMLSVRSKSSSFFGRYSFMFRMWVWKTETGVDELCCPQPFCSATISSCLSFAYIAYSCRPTNSVMSSFKVKSHLWHQGSICQKWHSSVTPTGVWMEFQCFLSLQRKLHGFPLPRCQTYKCGTETSAAQRSQGGMHSTWTEEKLLNLDFYILQEDKSLCFLVDMNLSASGQQRIELGSLFCVASAGRSDFTLF